MAKCIFDKATGQFINGARWDALPFDAATQVMLDLPDFPDVRTQRWDGATGVRNATPAELTAYDTAQVDREATANFDNAKALKAAALYFRARINELRAFHSLAPLTIADVRQGVIDAYKALP